MFRKILIANRGEIACRIIRTCRRLGIQTVAVYSDADSSSLAVSLADEAIRIGSGPVKESYLRIDAILDAARSTGAEAIHPGYGLLSEKRAFAEATGDANIVFIGPRPETLEGFGDKIKARAIARSAGVHPPPGSEGPVAISNVDQIRAEADSIGYPLLVKAAGGGGGIGMQIVHKDSQLERATKACSDRGRSAFADERVYLERYLSSPRHIEVQVLCDKHGKAIALGERECSVQRRHQKIIEESPSVAPFLTSYEQRHRLFESALRIVQQVGYEGAGTVEFIADALGDLWFLEVNARLQVEHPITEMVTGLDLVEWQIRIASGESLPNFDTTPHGHAVEARIYAEDPSRKFLPQPGTLQRLVWPIATKDIRIDTGVQEGDAVTPFYDPLIAKMVAFGNTRQDAIQRLLDALGQTQIELIGPKGPASTNLSFLQRVLRDNRFASGQYDTSLAETLASNGTEGVAH